MRIGALQRHNRESGFRNKKQFLERNRIIGEWKCEEREYNREDTLIRWEGNPLFVSVSLFLEKISYASENKNYKGSFQAEWLESVSEWCIYLYYQSHVDFCGIFSSSQNDEPLALLSSRIVQNYSYEHSWLIYQS